jgi:predicted acyltransferase
MEMSKPMNKTGRIVSLDALRGFDMFWITGGEELIFSLAALTGWPCFAWAARQMRHVPWEGFVFYDMIFPLFLFIAGVSMPFSLLKRKDRGDSLPSIYGHLAKRLLLLLLLGFAYNRIHYFNFGLLRWASVLGRIGLAWFFAALIVLNSSVKRQIAWFIGILLSYWAVVRLIPVPGFGAGVLTPEGNLCAYIDQKLLPGFLCCYKYGDNEGILATIPAVATALLGVLTGHFLSWEHPKLNGLKKGLTMLGAGIISLGAGKVWSFAFPIIKNIWTSSYVLFAGGWSLILLAVFYLIIDVWKIRRWSFPFIVIGLNAITIYILSVGIIDFQRMNAIFFAGVIKHFSAPAQPVFSAIGLLLLEWAFLYFLYRKKIFLKV